MPICRGELSFSNRSGSAGRALSILPGCMSRLHIFARLVFAYVSEPTISSVSRAISSGGIADGRSVEPAAAGFACGLGKSLRMISLVRNGGHRAIWPVGNAQTFFWPEPTYIQGKSPRAAVFHHYECAIIHIQPASRCGERAYSQHRVQMDYQHRPQGLVRRNGS